MDNTKIIQIKKIIMLICLGIMFSALFLPILVISGGEVVTKFSIIDLLLNSRLEFDTKVLGELIPFFLTYDKILLVLAVVSLGCAIFTILYPKITEKLRRVLCGIFSLVILVGVLITCLSAKTDSDTAVIGIGVGVYFIAIFLIVFLIYSITPNKLPLIEVNIYITLSFLCILLIYPYLNTVAQSLDKSGESISIIPKEFTINNFKFVLFNPVFYKGFGITVLRTICGTIAALLCTTVFSYGVSKSNLIGRNIYLKVCIFTMYFGGGLIPTFLLYNKLLLINNFFVYIIPNLINVFNMILMINYFKSLPSALEESAKIDGAGEYRILFSIIVPISKPIIAVIALYNAVGQWNSWYDGYMFMQGRPDLKPLQNVLIDIINESQIGNFLKDLPIPVKDLMVAPVAKSIVAAAMILTIGPIILCYPYLQRYFIKGMLLGSVKG